MSTARNSASHPWNLCYAFPPVPESPPDHPAPAANLPPRNFFQRRLIDPIVAQLTQGLTPEKLALTIAAGSATALFPVFGVTSLLCFLVALALRLNQPIIQILNQLLWPVHIAAFLLCAHFGEFLFRVPPVDRLQLHPHIIFERYFTHFWSHPVQSLVDYVKDNADSVVYSIVAWAILVPLFVPAVYFAVRPVMRGIARVKAETAARAAAKPPGQPIP